MIRLTLKGIRTLTERALRDQGFERSRIVSTEWIGERSKERRGPYEFRVARVIIEAPDGRRVAKLATISTDGSFSIA